MNHKSSFSDSSLRDPRVHRQNDIPSISRPRTRTTGGISERSTSRIGHAVTSIGRAAPFESLKKTAHHLLSKTSDTSTSPSRPRFATMPSRHQSFNTQTWAEKNMSNNVVSPPVVDSTVFNSELLENLEGTRTGILAVKFYSQPPVLAAGTESGPLNGATLPASARKPDPRLILSSLKSVVGAEHDVEKYLKAHELLATHQLDQVDFEDRDRMRANWKQHGKPCTAKENRTLTVLGEPLRRASIYSSTSMVLAGREHDLPIIVVNTVEELYRTGIYQPNLFRTLPNRARLRELIDIYDSEEQLPKSAIRSQQWPNQSNVSNAGFGANTSLHLESTPDVCALLTTYLTSLTEPILPPMFFRPIWDWCGIEEEDMLTMRRQNSFGPRLSYIPLARTYTSPAESTHILVAQLLLHLLPSQNFSLLVYLLAFFSQAALVREENGVGVSDLSKMFGGRLFGGDPTPNTPDGTRGTIDGACGKTTPARNGETMMSWFLRRWGPLSEGLFEVVEDAKMGLFRRPLARRDSFGKDILPNWPLGVGCSNTTHINSSFLDPPYDDVVDASAAVGDSANNDRMFVTPRVQLEEAAVRATLKSSGDITQSLIVPECDMDRDSVLKTPTNHVSPNETLEIAQLPLRYDNSSVSSTAALDERLLDMALPTILDQTLPTAPVICDDAQHHIKPRIFTDRETQTASSNPVELVDALHLTSYLESQLEERTSALKTSLAELTKSKLNVSKLNQRVHELEVRLSERHTFQGTDNTYAYIRHANTARFDERDEMKDAVGEIQKLVKN